MPFTKPNGQRDYKRWTEEGRVCSVCEVFFPWDMFSWKRSKRYKDKVGAGIHQLKQPKCQACAVKETQAWYAVNKEAAKNTRLLNNYGMTLNEYKARRIAQEDKCPICNKEFSDGAFGPDSPVVDHCHTGGHVRGIICNECNRGLGYFRDSPNALRNAASYLEES